MYHPVCECVPVSFWYESSTTVVPSQSPIVHVHCQHGSFRVGGRECGLEFTRWRSGSSLSVWCAVGEKRYVLVEALLQVRQLVTTGSHRLYTYRTFDLSHKGQARKASAAFHEAATLYQCFLDSKDEFAYVTSLTQEDVIAILAYASVRLGFLNYDALGDPNAASRLYKEATLIDPLPSSVSYDGMGQSLEASGAGENLQKATDAYRKALEASSGTNRHVMFRLAVTLDRLGEAKEANDIFDSLRRDEYEYACLVDSWGYVRWHSRKIPPNQLNIYRGTRDMLEIALKAASPLIEQGGLVCEFGVGGGRSMRMTQEILPLNTTIHGFDTVRRSRKRCARRLLQVQRHSHQLKLSLSQFTGLPQAWGNEPAGAYSTGGIVPNLEGNVFFHKGLFKDTIAPFLQKSGKDAFLAYGNIDCDLYTSTMDVLEAFEGRIRVGTILVFDEYICTPTWRQDEFRAWRDCCKRFGWKYEYLAFSLSTKQAVVRVIDT